MQETVSHLNMIRFYLALWAGKFARFAIKLLGRNASHNPGKIALKICPDFLKYIDKPEKIICVTGTNGKTTVCNMIEDALRANGHVILDNNLGSNTVAGVASTFLMGTSVFNKAKFNECVLEVDERSSLLIYKYVTPNYLVCTNLFRDSIKRNAHTDYISGIINAALPDSTTLILNADDLISGRLKADCPNKRIYFGIAPLEGERQEPNDIINDMRICPVCSSPMEFTFTRYHHIGTAHCTKCDLASPKADVLVKAVDYENGKITVDSQGSEEEYPLIHRNMFNIYNELAVITLLKTVGLDYDSIYSAVGKLKIVDSRFSERKVGGVEILSNTLKGQNPVACSRVCRFAADEKGNKAIFFMLDDINDARSSSENMYWIYESDFENLNNDSIKRFYVAGRRAQDMRYRLLLAGIPDEKITAFQNERDIVEHIDFNGIDKLVILFDLYLYGLQKEIRAELEKKLQDREKEAQI